MRNIITLRVPEPRPEPRGAQFVGHLIDLFSRGVAALRRTAAPRALTSEEEAENLRAYARSIQHSEPNFAADLFAAANRHEVGARA